MQVDVIRVTEFVALDAAANIRRTGDGYLTANPRVARTGIQTYAGSELGKAHLDKVRVYRPEAEVFDKAALATVAHRPITNDHPSEAVTADNWKKYAIGQTGETVARDGDFIRVPMVVMDGTAIKDVEAGKKELSLGYTSNLEWRAGQTTDGQEYDAVQTNIRINHLAIVDAARGGKKLRIGDVSTQNGMVVDAAALAAVAKLISNRRIAAKDERNVLPNSPTTVFLGDKKYPVAGGGRVFRSALVIAKELATTAGDTAIADAATSLLQQIDQRMERKTMDPVMKTIVVDSVSLEMSDTAAQVVQRHLGRLEADALSFKQKMEAAQEEKKKNKDTADAQIATLTTQVAAKDAELVTVKKQLEDSKLTPAKLDQLVKDRADVVAKAHAKIGDRLIVDGKTTTEMQRQVVDALLGDSAKGWTDDQVAISFATIVADLKPDQLRASDALARSFSGGPARGGPLTSDKALEDSRAAYEKRVQNAWKGDAKGAA